MEKLIFEPRNKLSIPKFVNTLKCNVIYAVLLAFIRWPKLNTTIEPAINKTAIYRVATESSSIDVKSFAIFGSILILSSNFVVVIVFKLSLLMVIFKPFSKV